MIMLIESKNLDAEKVTKNDVYIFQRKVSEVNRQYEPPVTGVIVAKEFDKGALSACRSLEANVSPLFVKEVHESKLEGSSYEYGDMPYTLQMRTSQNKYYDLIEPDDDNRVFFKKTNVQSNIESFVAEHINFKKYKNVVFKHVDAKGIEGEYKMRFVELLRIADSWSWQLVVDGKEIDIQELRIQVDIPLFYFQLKFIIGFELDDGRQYQIFEKKYSDGYVDQVDILIQPTDLES